MRRSHVSARRSPLKCRLGKTEASDLRRVTKWKHIKLWLLALGGVFLGWLATLALVMVFTDAAPGAIVIFPSDGFIQNLPENAAIAGGGTGWIAIRADTPGLGLTLYRAGALLVLPAGLPGCLPLPPA